MSRTTTFASNSFSHRTKITPIHGQVPAEESDVAFVEQVTEPADLRRREYPR